MVGTVRDPRSGEPAKKRSKTRGSANNPLSGVDVQSAGSGSAPLEAKLASAPELPSELAQQIQTFTMGQLFHLLRHIKKLSAQAPVQAQTLLVQHPPICHALLHAECLAGTIEEPAMPVENDELQRAKMKAKEMQEVVEGYSLPPPRQEDPLGQQAPMGTVVSVPKLPTVLPSMESLMTTPKAMSLAPGGPASGLPLPMLLPQQPVLGGPMLGANTSILPPPSSPPAPGALPNALPVQPLGVSTASGSVPGAPPGLTLDAPTKTLLNKLVHMSPAQIDQLPEATKMQVFAFLQQQQG